MIKPVDKLHKPKKREVKTKKKHLGSTEDALDVIRITSFLERIPGGAIRIKSKLRYMKFKKKYILHLCI